MCVRLMILHSLQKLKAKHQYDISQDGPNADQLALAKANLEAAKDTLSNYVITAPFDGVVAEVNVKVGEQVTTETRAVSVADFSQWIVETTDLTELEVVKLSVGQSVKLVPDALPTRHSTERSQKSVRLTPSKAATFFTQCVLPSKIPTRV